MSGMKHWSDCCRFGSDLISRHSFEMQFPQRPETGQSGFGLIGGVEETAMRETMRNCVAKVGPKDAADVRLAQCDRDELRGPIGLKRGSKSAMPLAKTNVQARLG